MVQYGSLELKDYCTHAQMHGWGGRQAADKKCGRDSFLVHANGLQRSAYAVIAGKCESAV